MEHTKAIDIVKNTPNRVSNPVNTPSCASDRRYTRSEIVQTPLIMQVTHMNTPSCVSDRRYTLLNMSMICSYTPNHVSGPFRTFLVVQLTPYTQYNYPLTMCEWS